MIRTDSINIMLSRLKLHRTIQNKKELKTNELIINYKKTKKLEK